MRAAAGKPGLDDDGLHGIDLRREKHAVHSRQPLRGRYRLGFPGWTDTHQAGGECLDCGIVWMPDVQIFTE